MTDETRSLSDVRIDDRGWGRYLDIPLACPRNRERYRVCLLDLQLPARHDWAVQETNYGKLVMEPFEPGFALTVGIAYRRALLSAIHGAAPTWVKIEHASTSSRTCPGSRRTHSTS